MSFLSDIMSGGVGDIVKSVVSVFDDLHTSDEEKAEIEVKMAGVIAAQMAQIEESLRARFKMVQEVITAEMKNGNTYTKNARPTIVYVGLFIHFLNAFAPWFGLEQVDIDENFTYVWGGVCGVWIVGRSAEKIGSGKKLIAKITGNPALDI